MIERNTTKCPACKSSVAHVMRKRSVQDRLIELEREIRDPSDLEDLDQAAQLDVFEAHLCAVRRTINEILCGLRGLCDDCRRDRAVVRAMSDAIHAKPAKPPQPMAAASVRYCACGHKLNGGPRGTGDHDSNGICYARLCFGSIDGKCGPSALAARSRRASERARADRLADPVFEADRIEQRAPDEEPEPEEPEHHQRELPRLQQ